MSTNGHLKFQGTNRATFVGETSNIMFDTTTTSLGIGVTGTDHPSSNLYITGNAYVSSNIAVGGVLTMGTVNVVARHDLESVTATGNTTPLTVEFQNTDTSLVASGNVEVAKELTVTGNVNVSSNLTVSGTGQTSTSSFDQAGALGSTLILKDDGSSVGNGGAIMFGASQGYFGAIKGGIDNGANNTAGRITFFTRPDWTNSTMSSAMTIKYDGKVGIGEDGPVNALHIRGSKPQLLIEGESNENANIDFSSGPSYRNRRHQIQTEHYALSGFATSNKMHFRVNEGGENTPSIRMTVRGDGNVGVGTSSPQTKFHLYDTTNEPTIALQHLSGTENNASANVLGNLALHYSARSGHGASVGIRSIRRANTWDDQADMEFYVRNGGYGSWTAMVINSTGSQTQPVRIGINTTDPEACFTIKQSDGRYESSNGSGLRFIQPQGTNRWDLGMVAHNDTNFAFAYNGGAKGYLNSGAGNSQLNFTGQHRTFVKDTPFTETENFEGLIVSADQNKYIKMSGGIEAGSNAITITESLPVVSLSVIAKDKKCFGVVSTSEDPEERKEEYGNFISILEKEKGDTRVYINSVGEGAIWVTNINGPLESGDYITTSNVAGYGQKQDSEFLANYTVAKITMDCDFEPVTQPVQVIKKNEEGENILDEHGQIQWEDHPAETEKAYKIRYLDADGNITDEANHVYKAAFVGCTYHCG